MTVVSGEQVNFRCEVKGLLVNSEVLQIKFPNEAETDFGVLTTNRKLCRIIYDCVFKAPNYPPGRHKYRIECKKGKRMVGSQTVEIEVMGVAALEFVGLADLYELTEGASHEISFKIRRRDSKMLQISNISISFFTNLYLETKTASPILIDGYSLQLTNIIRPRAGCFTNVEEYQIPICVIHGEGTYSNILRVRVSPAIALQKLNNITALEGETLDISIMVKSELKNLSYEIVQQPKRGIIADKTGRVVNGLINIRYHSPIYSSDMCDSFCIRAFDSNCTSGTECLNVIIKSNKPPRMVNHTIPREIKVNETKQFHIELEDERVINKTNLTWQVNSFQINEIYDSGEIQKNKYYFLLTAPSRAGEHWLRFIIDDGVWRTTNNMPIWVTDTQVITIPDNVKVVENGSTNIIFSIMHSDGNKMTDYEIELENNDTKEYRAVTHGNREVTINGKEMGTNILSVHVRNGNTSLTSMVTIAVVPWIVASNATTTVLAGESSVIKISVGSSRTNGLVYELIGETKLGNFETNGNFNLEGNIAEIPYNAKKDMWGYENISWRAKGYGNTSELARISIKVEKNERPIIINATTNVFLIMDSLIETNLPVTFNDDQQKIFNTNVITQPEGICSAKLSFDNGERNVVINALAAGDAKVIITASDGVWSATNIIFVTVKQTEPKESRYLDSLWTNEIGMIFVWVDGLPGGGKWDDIKTNGAWVGKAKVTYEQYKKGIELLKKVIGGEAIPVLPAQIKNPSQLTNTYEKVENNAVHNISPIDAAQYCAILNTNIPPRDLQWKYDLLNTTQAQWCGIAVRGREDNITNIKNQNRTTINLEGIDAWPFEWLHKINAYSEKGKLSYRWTRVNPNNSEYTLGGGMANTNAGMRLVILPMPK
ncbi:MAG: hypothetical protein N3J91_04240 [Verrucomicrobiae bacterium]|nr:hypothetical protein [Verrucomicrobiae bacterium]